MAQVGIKLRRDSATLVVSEDNRILNSAQVFFPQNAEPKTGASLGTARRLHRGNRRQVKRRRFKRKEIANLFSMKVTDNDSQRADVWKLRREALERRLSKRELYYVLSHIVKRPGFKSSRKDQANSTEQGPLLDGLRATEEKFISGDDETIGALLSRQKKKKNGRGSYENMVSRTLILEEVEKVFAAQKKLGSRVLTKVLKTKVIAIIERRKPARSSLDMVGYCAFKMGEKRLLKASLLAERFVLAQRIADLAIRKDIGAVRFLSDDERDQVYLLSKKYKSISFRRLRKELKLTEDERFNLCTYRSTASLIKAAKAKHNRFPSLEEIVQNAEKSEFIGLESYHFFKSIYRKSGLDDSRFMKDVSSGVIDKLIYRAAYKPEKDTISLAGRLGIADECITSIFARNYIGTLSVGRKIVKKMLPLLEEGRHYSEVKKKLGLKEISKIRKTEKILPPMTDVRNPIVLRAANQARRLLNTALENYSVDRIRIISSREISLSSIEKKKYERQILDRYQKRIAAKKDAQKIFGSTSEYYIELIRLWRQQGGRCAYSGEYFDKKLLKDQFVGVSHIIPLARSNDHSLSNKVFASQKLIRRKGELTPREAFYKTKHWGFIESFAETLPGSKKARLLKNLGEADILKLNERDYTESAYIAKYFGSEISKNLGHIKVDTVKQGLMGRVGILYGYEGDPQDISRSDFFEASFLSHIPQEILSKIHFWDLDDDQLKKSSYLKELEQELSCLKPFRGSRRKTHKSGSLASHKETIYSDKYEAKFLHKSVDDFRDNPKELADKIGALLDGAGDKYSDFFAAAPHRLKMYTSIRDFLIEGEDKFKEEGLYYAGNKTQKLLLPQRAKGKIKVRGGVAEHGQLTHVMLWREEIKDRYGYGFVPVYAGSKKEDLAGEFDVWFSTSSKVLRRPCDLVLFKGDLIKTQNVKGETNLGYFQGIDVASGTLSLIRQNPYTGRAERVGSLLGMTSIEKVKKRPFTQPFRKNSDSV